MVKRIMTTVLAGAMVLSMAACGSGETSPSSTTSSTVAEVSAETSTPTEVKKELTGEIDFWHFNAAEGPILARAFEKANPGVKVKDLITSDTGGAYQTKIQAASRSGNLPDVYASENAFVKRFVNMPAGYQTLDFPDVKDITSKLVPYTVQIGTNAKGELVALSHQACAGGIGYKREMAKKYLGTDNPEEIGKMLTEENLLVTARKVKEVSAGKANLFVGVEEVYKIFAGSRDHAWVEEGKFVIDPKMDRFLDLAKTMRDEKLEGGLPQWQAPWSASIQDEKNMCYAIPTWGISWIIDTNESDKVKVMTNEDHATAGTGGRWGITTAIPYAEGGTWFGISQNAKNKDLGWEFIKYITSDPSFVESTAKAGDFVSNLDSIAKYQADESFINKVVNQNVYKVYGPMLDKINGSIITQYDDTVKIAFLDSMNTYLAGKISKDEMIKQLKSKLKSQLQAENISFE